MLVRCREKESGGALDVPGFGKLIELEYAQVADRKLRGQLRNVSNLELQARAWPKAVKMQKRVRGGGGAQSLDCHLLGIILPHIRGGLTSGVGFHYNKLEYLEF